MTQLTVIGGGSWATALIKILMRQGDIKIHWWVRRPEVAAHINEHGRNPNYLRSVQLDTQRLEASADLKACIAASDHLLFAVPSAFLEDVLAELDPTEYRGKTVISAIKGVVPQQKKIVGEYLFELGVKPKDFAVITGPCHAEEVAQDKLSYLTVASTNEQLAEHLAGLLRCDFIRVASSTDIYGTEIAAVLKNVYAIAAGISHGLGYGDNYIAVLVSNAIREIKAIYLGGTPH